MLPIMGLCWLASAAFVWSGSQNRLKQMAGNGLLAALALVVLYLMFAFVKALVG